jgi:hypothetical protein
MTPDFLKNRPLSWSAISSFEYDPDQWYRKYILGEKDPETKEMRFGKTVGERLASDPNYLHTVPRLPIFEYKLEATYADIPMIGFMDTFCPDTPAMGEYKTGKKAWDQKRADSHGQIDMYLLMLYLTQKIKPEQVKCHLHWLPTQENGDFTISFVSPIRVRSFETKRTMKDLLVFGSRIRTTVENMQEYAKARQ